MFLIGSVVTLVAFYRLFPKKTTVIRRDFSPTKDLEVPNDDGYYFALAQRLENAMARWGTDEEEIFKVLNNRSLDELRAIYLAFDVRQWTPIGTWRESAQKDLIDWFKEELSGSDLAKVKSIMLPTGYWPKELN